MEKYRRIKGFTLLELLVVLVIIGMMSAIIAPRLTGSLTGMNLKTASRKVSASLRHARSNATSERLTYISVFDFEKNRLIILPCQEESGEIPEECMFDNEESLSRSKIYNLPEGVRFEKAENFQEETDSDYFQIAFYPGGGSSGGQVIVTDERKGRYTINVDFITGTVKLSG